jgi:DNA-nicking Smr family endonuclease
MARRVLDQDERHLWEAVARTARPLSRRKVPAEPAAPPADAHNAPADPAPKPHSQPRIAPFALGERAAPLPPRRDVAPSMAEALAAAPLSMDARTHARMTRGKLDPEARIDLHGMTLTEAHGELIHFLLSARARGLRLVLVITGKGKPARDQGPIPERQGALRHQVPHWLRLPPLGPVVQQVAEAHLRHGGPGAYYVYLRRR